MECWKAEEEMVWLGQAIRPNPGLVEDQEEEGAMLHMNNFKKLFLIPNTVFD